jgi:DNA-directed RNA polymerase specialized sigma24 family protein
MVFGSSNPETIGRGSSTLHCPGVLSDVFERSRIELLWLAEIVLGSRVAADACLADAMIRVEEAGYVAPGWCDLWVKRCVVHTAIERNRNEIKRIASVYSRDAIHKSSPHTLHVNDARILRSLAANTISHRLNAFERAALMLHGYLGFSVQDCAITIECHRSLIELACSNALWEILGAETKSQIEQEEEVEECALSEVVA